MSWDEKRKHVYAHTIYQGSQITDRHPRPMAWQVAGGYHQPSSTTGLIPAGLQNKREGALGLSATIYSPWWSQFDIQPYTGVRSSMTMLGMTLARLWVLEAFTITFQRQP